MERIIFVVLLLLFVTGVFITILTLIPQKTPITGYFISSVSDNVFSNATAYSQQRKIVRNSTNAIHVIYQINSTNSAHSFSTDEGYSWSSQDIIQQSSGDQCPYPTLVRNSTNALIVICEQGNGTYISTDSGGSWIKAPVAIGFVNKGIQPSAYIDSNNVIHVAYYWSDLGLTTVNYTQSTDGGLTWSSSINISQWGVASQPSIVATSINKIYVMWLQLDGSTTDIYFSACISGCTNPYAWSPPALVYNSTQNASSLSSVVTLNSYVQIAFSDGSSGNGEIYHSKYNGTAWSTAANVSRNSTYQDTDSSISTNGGRIYLIWRNGTDTAFNRDLFFSYSDNAFIDGAETWSNVEQITNSPFNDTFPSSISNVTGRGDYGNESYFESIWTEQSASNKTKYYIRDTYAPNYQNLGQNTSNPSSGSPVLIYSQGKDTIRLDYAVLETNETGTAQNKTLNYNSSMNVSNSWKWSNFTWQNTSLSSGNVAWKIWYNDTSGNWMSTPSMSFTIGGTNQLPRWSTPQNYTPTNYSPTATSYFNITWTDDADVSIVYFESNYSGTPRNYTMNKITGNIYNYSAILPGGTWYWKSYANDTANAWNSTPQWNFTITPDTTPPQYSNLKVYPSSPTTYDPNAVYWFNATWTDANGVSDVVLQFDGTNYSYLLGSVSKTGDEYSKTFIGLSVGTHYYKWLANDSSNNWADSGMTSYVITAPPTGGGGPPPPPPPQPPQEEPPSEQEILEFPSEIIPPPPPGTVLTLPAGGLGIRLKSDLILSLYPTKNFTAIIRNITEVEAGKYKILLCNQASLASYEINVTADVAYFCMNYSAYANMVSEPTISLYKFFGGDWKELGTTDIIRYPEKKIICGRISSTPYMVSGFKISPTAELALKSITSANDTILKAKLEGLETTQAEDYFQQSLKNYYNCKYEEAQRLAELARESIGVVIPNIPLFVWIIILIAAAGVLYWYYRLKRKVRVKVKESSPPSKK